MNNNKCFLCQTSMRKLTYIIYKCNICKLNTSYCVNCNQSIIVLLEDKYYKCCVCEILIQISTKEYIYPELKNSLTIENPNAIDNPNTIASTQHELYSNPLQDSPFVDYLEKPIRSNNDKSRISKLKFHEPDESWNLKAEQTAEKTVNKDNKENENIVNSSYSYFSSDFENLQSTPHKTLENVNFENELSPLIPRKVDFNQKLYEGGINSHKFTLHTIIDSKPGSKCNIFQNLN